LLDMLHAADKILERRPASRELFVSDEVELVWAVRHAEIMGEASVHVPGAIRERHPEVDWAALRGVRNRLVHGYFDIDAEVVWQTIISDVPRLREQLVAILEELDQES
jgi:uncharacterized protein with HEPN domain